MVVFSELIGQTCLIVIAGDLVVELVVGVGYFTRNCEHLCRFGVPDVQNFNQIGFC